MFNIGDKLNEENYIQGAIWCNNNGCSIDYNWVIVPLKPIKPTKEEVRKIRQALYHDKKDPITCQIESLRDEEPSPEIEAEITKLINERKLIVEEIRANNPYPEE